MAVQAGLTTGQQDNTSFRCVAIAMEQKPAGQLCVALRSGVQYGFLTCSLSVVFFASTRKKYLATLHTKHFYDPYTVIHSAGSRKSRIESIKLPFPEEAKQLGGEHSFHFLNRRFKEETCHEGEVFDV